MILNVSGIIVEKVPLSNRVGKNYGTAYAIQDVNGERYPFLLTDKKKDEAFNIQIGDSVSVMLLVTAVYDKKYGRLGINMFLSKLYREVKI